MDHKCTFFTDKDHVGTICLSSFVVGMVISLTVGLKFLHHKQKEREYESVQSHPIPYSSTYRNILNSSVNRIANPRRTFRGTSYANENDNYLDPVPKNADSNYLDPVPCHRYSDYLTPSQGEIFPRMSLLKIIWNHMHKLYHHHCGQTKFCFDVLRTQSVFHSSIFISTRYHLNQVPFSSLSRSNF
ncbi:uncharacterized protein LOC125656243 [Ostrea edulis]|uniref:uncharacterized protein LOC125656243 n=1 Tax=Ostrea edulis TaxID=37623 RepID=UPI0024AF3119|nr:uncharacterized protein LOC125656243 [Ostrea edulis]